MGTKSTRTVKLSDDAVALINALCSRFNQSQSQVVSTAISKLHEEFKDAKMLPVFAVSNDAEGEQRRPLHRATGAAAARGVKGK